MSLFSWALLLRGCWRVLFAEGRTFLTNIELVGRTLRAKRPNQLVWAPFPSFGATGCVDIQLSCRHRNDLMDSRKLNGFWWILEGRWLPLLWTKKRHFFNLALTNITVYNNNWSNLFGTFFLWTLTYAKWRSKRNQTQRFVSSCVTRKTSTFSN